jgi:N-acetylneuraminate lyase
MKRDTSMPPLTGLIAATYTPLQPDGELDLSQVPKVVDKLLAEQVDGFYVCGSTGEGMSLSSDERRSVTEAFVTATAGRVPVIVQVGHNSLAEARALAAHAQQCGADVVSATCPSYFKIDRVPMLVECMAELAAAAPELPFYYYHIPALTSTPLDMVEFLYAGGSRIPNLAGLKYTTPTLHEYLACREIEDGRFDILWGVDEMLLAALATGARGAVGSTYNIAAPLYRRIINAFDAGNLEEARQLQLRSVRMIRTMAQFPFHSAMKEVLRMLGLDVGPCRLPQPPLSPADVDSLRAQLEAIGFFDWR